MNVKEQNPNLDKLILESLAAGLTQNEISLHFIKMGIDLNSLSIIEKRIKGMKKEYRANTLFHLAIIVKRKGII